jgi:hypothetical protein
MKNLIKAVKAEIEKRYAVTAADFTRQGEEIEPRAYRLIGRKWNAKPYKGTPEQVEAKIRKALKKQEAAALARAMAKIEAAAAAPATFPNPVIIRMDSHKGYMGWQWKASDNYGHETRYTGGYGYDKHSTALAEILNMHLPILRRLYLAKAKAVNKANRDALGYGSGYGMIPSFEGGVGSGCHVEILRRLGYVVTDGDTVIVIYEK